MFEVEEMKITVKLKRFLLNRRNLNPLINPTICKRKSQPHFHEDFIINVQYEDVFLL